VTSNPDGLLRHERQVPEAALTEVERELDRQKHAQRVAVLVRVAQAGNEAGGACPKRSAALARRGQFNETLRIDGNQATP
jgi:hypothetical protein